MSVNKKKAVTKYRLLLFQLVNGAPLQSTNNTNLMIRNQKQQIIVNKGKAIVD